jgi:hypothetical protein
MSTEVHWEVPDGTLLLLPVLLLLLLLLLPVLLLPVLLLLPAILPAPAP